MMPAWVPSEGYGRGGFDANERGLTGGAFPMFYDLPLFNTAMMESLGKGAPWALAKAPFGKNGIASAGEPHDFLSEAQKPYASTLVDIQYGDEKQWDNTEGDYYQKWFEWSKTAYPGAVVHSNQYDDYTWRRPQVLDYYVRAVKPDLLSWDTYYYSTTSGPGPDRVVTSLLNNQTWQAQREYALKGLTGDGSSPILYGQYLDYNWDANVSASQKAIVPSLGLATGQKWFGLFRMEYNGYDRSSIIDHDGAPTRSFYEFTRIFRSVRYIGEYTKAMDSTFVALKPGQYDGRDEDPVLSGYRYGNFASGDEAEARAALRQWAVDLCSQIRFPIDAGDFGDARHPEARHHDRLFQQVAHDEAVILQQLDRLLAQADGHGTDHLPAELRDAICLIGAALMRLWSVTWRYERIADYGARLIAAAVQPAQDSRGNEAGLSVLALCVTLFGLLSHVPEQVRSLLPASFDGEGPFSRVRRFLRASDEQWPELTGDADPWVAWAATRALAARQEDEGDPRASLDAGIGVIPEDRTTDGIIASFSIADNLVLDQFGEAPFSKGPMLKLGVIDDNARAKQQEYDIRLTDVSDPISSLSGGNQQKVVVAREMSKELNLLVANQPTRGVDVGSIEFIHKRIVGVRDQGTPVLLISSELDEVLSLADRVVVMYRGRIMGIVPAGTPRDVLGLMMAGVPLDEAMSASEEHSDGAGEGRTMEGGTR